MFKVKVKAPYLDDTGLHRRGEVIDASFFDSTLHDLIGGKTEPEKAPEKKGAKVKK